MAKSALLDSPKVTTVIQRAASAAVEAALAAVQEQEQQKQRKRPTKPPPSDKVERQVAKAAAEASKRPKKRGFRGVPPPVQFDFSGLPDSAYLTEYETAAVGRWSTSTLQIWRQRDHPLRWTKVGGGRVRYRVADIRAFLALGYRVHPGRPRKKDATPAPRPPAQTAEHLQDPKRRRPRARADAAVPAESSS